MLNKSKANAIYSLFLNNFLLAEVIGSLENSILNGENVEDAKADLRSYVADPYKFFIENWKSFKVMFKTEWENATTKKAKIVLNDICEKACNEAIKQIDLDLIK